MYDNDTSCDVRDLFVKMLRDNPDMHVWEVVERLLKEYYKEQMDDINVVLALADLSIAFSKLTPELVDTALKVIQKEIDRIHNWSEPEKRKTFLIDYEGYLKTTLENK